jgi:hypothetical protein
MSLLRTAARVGVATSVHGRVRRRQAERWAAEDQQASAPTQPAASPGPGEGADRLGQLQKLGELRSAGVLTETEFEAEKAKILQG